ncbi:MAG: Trm112 family protein [Holosporales bacterium]|nr:Trm112 family protein [Holosporales bacterium]
METSSCSKKDRKLDRRLLDIMVCPVTKTPLEYDQDQDELISKQAKLAYPIRNGVPIMLASEARKLED